MGKTRKRVTFLVLSLEAIGLLMLALSVYLAGAMQLTCEKASASDGARISCEATEKRFLGLVTLQRRRYQDVHGAEAEPPALGRTDYWLSLSTPQGNARILAGSRSHTDDDVRQVNEWLRQDAPEPLVLKRSAAPFAAAAAVFGCIWILVISLIMREFLGYHTPWWWRVLGRE